MKTEKQRLHLERLAKLRLGSKHSKKTKRILSIKASLRIGESSSNWKGGRMLIGGYWYILSPDHPNKTQMGYVAEHRLVMEKKIGRFLKKEEIVHHIDGIKTHNAESNLVLCQSQSDHNRHHNKPRNKKGQFFS